MEHFIAYHSVRIMGYSINSVDKQELRFLSRKFSLLRKAIGNTVWIVKGIPERKKTKYLLCSAFIGDRVEIEDESSNLYVISGHKVNEFEPPLNLQNFDWFPALMKSQSNFSLGLNRINDETIVTALNELEAKSNLESFSNKFPDIDLLSYTTEGTKHLIIHFRRERNKAIIEKKKESVLKTSGRLQCEVCGFDFSVVYGELGNGFCEVHHIVPLSASSDPVTTTLNDLAVVCSNCHRIIHRSVPMVSIFELSEIVMTTPNLSLHADRADEWRFGACWVYKVF
jgi:hypothetical protein